MVGLLQQGQSTRWQNEYKMTKKYVYRSLAMLGQMYDESGEEATIPSGTVLYIAAEADAEIERLNARLDRQVEICNDLDRQVSDLVLRRRSSSEPGTERSLLDEAAHVLIDHAGIEINDGWRREWERKYNTLKPAEPPGRHPLAGIAVALEADLFTQPLEFRGGMGLTASQLKECLRALQTAVK